MSSSGKLYSFFFICSQNALRCFRTFTNAFKLLDGDVQLIDRVGDGDSFDCRFHDAFSALQLARIDDQPLLLISMFKLLTGKIQLSLL